MSQNKIMVKDGNGKSVLGVIPGLYNNNDDEDDYDDDNNIFVELLADR